jgi:hypothetical protein
MVWQHICKRIVQYESISIILFSKPKVIESLYQSLYMLTVLMHVIPSAFVGFNNE